MASNTGRTSVGEHAQDLVGGSLSGQGMRKVGVARLQFLEQPRVLDRDHRLVREGLEQGDLPVGEGTNRQPRDPDRADGARSCRSGMDT